MHLLKSKYKIVKINNNKKETKNDFVVIEFPLKIFVNDIEFLTLLCSPEKLEYLVIGNLYSNMLISHIREIKSIKINMVDGIADVKLKKDVDLGNRFKDRIVYSTCGSFYKTLKLKKLKNNLRIDKDRILRLMRNLQESSKLFMETGCVHSSGLASKDKILFLSEDIGRHNTIDKIIGYSLVEGINNRGDKIILTTGRLTSEMILKSSRARFPVVVSKSAPTNMAIELAEHLNVTLIGFARGKRLNVYTNKGLVF